MPSSQVGVFPGIFFAKVRGFDPRPRGNGPSAIIRTKGGGRRGEVRRGGCVLLHAEIISGLRKLVHVREVGITVLSSVRQPPGSAVSQKPAGPVAA